MVTVYPILQIGMALSHALLGKNGMTVYREIEACKGA